MFWALAADWALLPKNLWAELRKKGWKEGRKEGERERRRGKEGRKEATKNSIFFPLLLGDVGIGMCILLYLLPTLP